MKTLKHLEKSRFIWFLIGVCVVFFILRLPSLVEPNWYGDEGIYQVIGQALQHGKGLYIDVWDNKPPLLYILYAIFSGDQFSLRFVSLLFGIAATTLFYILSRKVLGAGKGSAIATLLFAVLFGTPYLEGNIANAENFMLLPVTAAALLVYKLITTKPKAVHVHQSFLSLINSHPAIFSTGILLGFAFLFKIVAVFDFAAFTIFFLITLSKESPPRGRTIFHKIKRLFSSGAYFLVPFVSGFLLPILITFIYFTLAGSLVEFVQAAFLGNVAYVNYGNNFVIPQGFLVIKFLLFLLAFVVLLRKSQSFAKPILFVVVWFLFAIFSSFFSQRPYTHYLLVVLPSFCLLVGLLFTATKPRVRIGAGILVLFAIVVSHVFFQVYGIGRTARYYQNVLSFLSGHTSVRDYQTFFDPETPRDYDLVSYINHHTTARDQIYIWGDSPQIYALTKKLPPNKYTASYHIIEHENAFEETQEAIDKTKPKFIITLSEAPPLPFRLPNYAGTYGIKGAAIYERTF